MEENYTTEDFLARWANGTLSEKEKKDFEDTDEHAFFKAILDGTDALEVPEYDKESLFQKVKEQKMAQGRVVPLLSKRTYAIAASIALLIGMFFFFNRATSHATSYGEQLVVLLPDESEVILNANSSIKYSKSDWSKKRTLTLKGEAFFKVKKGSDFTVSTKQGTVSVLGTQFTTSAHDGFFEVKCFEGKVEVATKNRTTILTRGMALRSYDGKYEPWNFQDADGPNWLQEESSFSNAPLSQVITAIENQYKVRIDASKIKKEVRYTGGFIHTDLDKALKTVFNPLEITFTFADGKTIVLAPQPE